MQTAEVGLEPTGWALRLRARQGVQRPPGGPGASSPRKVELKEVRAGRRVPEIPVLTTRVSVEFGSHTSEGLLVPMGQVTRERPQELVIVLWANSAGVVAHSVGEDGRVPGRKAAQRQWIS